MDFWPENLKDWTAALGPIATAVIALLALGTWRRQLRGTRDMDLTRRIRLGAIKVREAVGSLWSVGKMLDDWLIHAENAGRDPQEELTAAHQSMLGNSLRHVSENVWVAYSELRVAVQEAEAAWAIDVHAELAALRKDLRSFNDLVTGWGFSPFTLTKSNGEVVESNHYWSSFDEQPNQTGQSGKIEQALQALLSVCRPPRASWYSKRRLPSLRVRGEEVVEFPPRNGPN